MADVLRMIYLNESKDQQKTILEQLSDTKKVNRYYLMDVQKKKHLVCAKFFGKIYQISHTTLLKYLDQKTNFIIRSNPPQLYGKWNRNIEWQEKVDTEKFKEWIERQPKYFSYYTRT
jgi:hypothetical protein